MRAIAGWYGALHFSNEFEALFAVGREYLKHLQARGASDAAAPAPAAPSLVERAASMLHRAEVLAVLGRTADSRNAASATLADLAEQHPASPRLVRARQLAAVDAP